MGSLLLTVLCLSRTNFLYVKIKVYKVNFAEAILQEKQEKGHSICHERICHHSLVRLPLWLSTAFVCVSI